MALKRLGSKSEAFQRDGQTWNCSTGLPSDIKIEIGDISFNLHKFPLLSRSGLLEKRIGEFSGEDGTLSVLKLHDMPGGSKAFELIAKFCYGVKIELTSLNVVGLRCASEYLIMNEEFGEGNLISQTESFLNEVFANWGDTLKALKTCEEVLPVAEDLHIVSRCINSLATKACADQALLSWPVSGANNPPTASNKKLILWNGISTGGTSTSPEVVADDWWYEDVSFLSLPLFKRLIRSVELGGMKPERIAGSLMYYAKRHIPSMNKQSSFTDTNQVNPGTAVSVPLEADQRALVEEIAGLLPNQKGVTQTNFLLRLLRTAMAVHANSSCREDLEKRIGVQLEQACLEDLLIPNMGNPGETMYDIDCFQRILDHYMVMDQVAEVTSSPCIVEEESQVVMVEAASLAPVTLVASLVDSYLAEVAPDVNLKFPKFQAIAAAIPDYGRPLADGIYRAIDIFLKAHPWLTDTEREQICRLMNCQKLSLEASTHAAQNERLPLRVIVQVLFFEQVRLRTSIAGWFFVSDNVENPNGLSLTERGSVMDDVRERISEIEKDCHAMRKDIQKLVKTKRGWNFFRRKKPQSSSSVETKNSSNLKAPPQTSKNGKV